MFIQTIVPNTSLTNTNDTLNPLTTYYRYIGEDTYKKIVNYNKPSMEKGKKVPPYDYTFEAVYNEGTKENEVWFTEDFYPFAKVAKSLLALPVTPKYRVRFNVTKNTPVSSEIGVVAKIDKNIEIKGNVIHVCEAGGGEEYKVTNIDLKVQCWLEKLSDKEHDSLIFFFRLKQAIKRPILYDVPYNSLKEFFYTESKGILIAVDNPKTVQDPDVFHSTLQRLAKSAGCDPMNGYNKTNTKNWLEASYFYFLLGLRPQNCLKVLEQVVSFTEQYKRSDKGYLDEYYKFFMRALVDEGISAQLLSDVL